MKKIYTTLTIALFAILFFSLSSQAQSIEKKWVFDNMDFILPENATDEEIEQYEMMKGFIEMAMEEMRGSVTIEFMSNGTYQSSSVDENDQVKEESGTWNLEGNQLYMTSDNTGEEEAITIELKDSEMRFVVEENGQTMYMIFVPY